MKFFRIGEKVVSREKLVDALTEILSDREAGATQEEAARAFGVQRTFVSFVESLGEIRRGARVALVAFPVANAAEIKQLAEARGIDFVLVFSQAERESIENAPGAEVFNRLLETLATLKDFDSLVLLASDWRVELIERILGNTEVIGIPLGPSPLREDVEVDIGELERVLAGVLAARRARPHTGRVGAVLREAAERAGRWTQSKK